MDRLGFLNSIHPITSDEYGVLLSHLKEKTFRKGENIIMPGQVQRHLYFVERGTQMCYFEKDGKTHVVAFTYPPNLCAIPDSFSQQRPSMYYYTCLSDTVMSCLAFEQLQAVYRSTPNIETLFRKINEKLLSGALTLHLEFRSMGIEERFTTFCRRSPHLLQQVPHKYIASYLGIDPTNFSKLFNQVRF